MGDAIHSVSILHIVQIEEKGEFVEKVKTKARDYGPLWPVSLQAWGKDGIVGANVSHLSSLCGDHGELNLLTYVRDLLGIERLQPVLVHNSAYLVRQDNIRP